MDIQVRSSPSLRTRTDPELPRERYLARCLEAVRRKVALAVSFKIRGRLTSVHNPGLVKKIEANKDQTQYVL